MITEWKYVAIVISVNRSAGNSLASIAAKFPDDPNAELDTFTNGIPLSPQAWVIETSCTQSFVDLIDALNEDASIDDPRLQYLVDRGLTASIWGQAKQTIKATWYQVYQDDGSVTYDESALSTWVAANGYSIVEGTP